MRVLAVLLVPWALIALSCGGEVPPPAVVDGNVGTRDGAVVAPGATILRGGELHDESVAIGPGDLVAIERGGEIFFYHPLAGDAPLTLETSRLSVGYFAAGLDAGAADDGTTEALTLRPDGASVRSETGVELTLRVAGAPVAARNTANRWAAITTDGNLTPYYLLPTSNPLPTNIVDAFLSDVGATGASTDSRDDIEAIRELVIHGAVLRALPLLIFSDNIETARQSRVADPALFANLALFDFSHLLVNGFQSFIGLFPIECVDALVSSALKTGLDSYVGEYLDGSWDRDAVHALYKEQLKNAANDGLSCALEATATIGGVLGGLAIEVFSSFLDIVALGNWLVNDALLGTYQAAFGLTAYDEVSIDVPAVPVVVDTVPLAAPARDVAVLLSDGYVVTRDALHVIEVEADGTATAVAERPLTFGRGVDVSGSQVFTAATGLQLWSTTNPAMPSLGSRVGFGTESYGVAVGGGYVFVAAGAYSHDDSTGVFAVTRVLDPTDIDGIEWTGGVELSAEARDLVVTEDNQHVVVIDEYGDLHVIDVRIPAGPAEVGQLSGSGNGNADAPRGMFLRGDTLYIANGRLRIVDISDRSAPREVFASGPDGLRDVDFDGSKLYATGGIGGGWLGTFDVSDPTNPVLESSLEFDHVGNALDVYSGFAFVATHAGTAGELVVIDLDGG